MTDDDQVEALKILDLIERNSILLSKAQIIGRLNEAEAKKYGLILNEVSSLDQLMSRTVEAKEKDQRLFEILVEFARLVASGLETALQYVKEEQGRRNTPKYPIGEA